MQDNIIFLVVCLFVAYLLIPSSDYQEKALYFSYCSDFQHNTYSCPKNENIRYSKRVFKVFPKEQLVISKDMMTEPKSCVVFDKNSWRCENESMIEGNYSATSLNTSLDKKISASSYYMHSIINFFK